MRDIQNPQFQQLEHIRVFILTHSKLNLLVPRGIIDYFILFEILLIINLVKIKLIVVAGVNNWKISVDVKDLFFKNLIFPY